MKIYDHPLYRESMARARWQAGDLEGAIAELERLVALTDARLDIPIHYVKAHYQLGQLHELQGNQDRARDWLPPLPAVSGRRATWISREIQAARKKTRRIILSITGLNCGRNRGRGKLPRVTRVNALTLMNANTCIRTSRNFFSVFC